MEAKHLLLTTHESMKKDKRKKKKHLKTNENGNTMVRNVWEAAKSSGREVYRDTSQS